MDPRYGQRASDELLEHSLLEIVQRPNSAVALEQEAINQFGPQEQCCSPFRAIGQWIGIMVPHKCPKWNQEGITTYPRAFSYLVGFHSSSSSTPEAVVVMLYAHSKYVCAKGQYCRSNPECNKMDAVIPLMVRTIDSANGL